MSSFFVTIRRSNDDVVDEKKIMMTRMMCDGNGDFDYHFYDHDHDVGDDDDDDDNNQEDDDHEIIASFILASSGDTEEEIDHDHDDQNPDASMTTTSSSSSWEGSTNSSCREEQEVLDDAEMGVRQDGPSMETMKGCSSSHTNAVEILVRGDHDDDDHDSSAEEGEEAIEACLSPSMCSSRTSSTPSYSPDVHIICRSASWTTHHHDGVFSSNDCKTSTTRNTRDYQHVSTIQPHWIYSDCDNDDDPANTTALPGVLDNTVTHRTRRKRRGQQKVEQSGPGGCCDGWAGGGGPATPFTRHGCRSSNNNESALLADEGCIVVEPDDESDNEDMACYDDDDDDECRGSQQGDDDELTVDELHGLRIIDDLDCEDDDNGSDGDHDIDDDHDTEMDDGVLAHNVAAAPTDTLGHCRSGDLEYIMLSNDSAEIILSSYDHHPRVLSAAAAAME